MSTNPTGPVSITGKLRCLFMETLKKWMNNNPFQSSAALAFYIMLSLSPALLIVISSAGYFIGENTARAELIIKADKYIGKKGAELISTVMANSRPDRSSLLAALTSIFAIFLGATAVFTQIQFYLNQIWEVPKPSGKSLLTFLKNRMKSLFMIFSIAAIFVVSLVLNAALQIVAQAVNEFIPSGFHLIRYGSYLVSFLIISLLFAAIYKVLPDVRIQWKNVWMGSVISSLLFLSGQIFITVYLSSSHAATLYGAAGSLVFFMLWIYYSSLIFFFGAVFTNVYTRRQAHYEATMTSGH